MVFASQNIAEIPGFFNTPICNIMFARFASSKFKELCSNEKALLSKRMLGHILMRRNRSYEGAHEFHSDQYGTFWPVDDMFYLW